MRLVCVNELKSSRGHICMCAYTNVQPKVHEHVDVHVPVSKTISVCTNKDTCPYIIYDSNSQVDETAYLKNTPLVASIIITS